ncbi:MAG: hypothetical protein ACE5DX_05680 [Candidatus Dojkabacteria bacterium]
MVDEYKDKGVGFTVITLGSTLTSFASPSLKEKKKLKKDGKAYFPPEWVANKLVEILKSDDLEEEYVLYPSEHGFGSWKKP